MSTKTSGGASVRERLLAAASELFYSEGVNTVGIDRVLARAAVAKASLYSSFGSKDELVRAYLAGRHEALRKRITQGLTRYQTPRERLLGVFDVLAERVADAGFLGCAFLRASAELRPGSAVRDVCDGARAWIRELFIDLGRQAGAGEPEALAQQLVLLYDGAMVAAQMDRTRTSPATARAIAAALLDAAIRRPPTPAAATATAATKAKTTATTTAARRRARTTRSTQRRRKA